MIKKTFLLALVFMTFSCEKNDSFELNEETSKELPIEYVDYIGSNSKSMSTLNSSVPSGSYDLYDLSANCDLSDIGFDSFTEPVQWYFNEDQFVPNIDYNNDGYGEFPSLSLPRALTGIYSNDSPNDGFLPVTNMQLPAINPVTGNEYYTTRINNFYNEYFFGDSGHYGLITDDQGEVSWGLIYDYVNGEVGGSNELRDIIACKLLEKAAEIDPTAFIWDIGVNNPGIALSSKINSNSRIILVYVRWGYHY